RAGAGSDRDGGCGSSVDGCGAMRSAAKGSISPSGLVAHLARFAGALRGVGVGVTLSDEADAVAALGLVDLGDREEVRRALRIALKVRPGDRSRFEELFELFWRLPADGSRERPSGRRTLSNPRLRAGSPSGRPPGTPEDEGGASR